MPDALSKTVPIWIAVLNRYFFPGNQRARTFNSPTTVLPPSEHSQIEARLDDFVEQLKSLNLDLEHVRGRLNKPLLPLWVTQDLPLPALPPSTDFHPVILCTASRRVPGGEDSEQGYIQGAADDSESWAQGLTPTLFWQHKATLVETAEDDLPDLIASLARGAPGSGQARCALIPPTGQIYIGSVGAADEAPARFALHVTCTAAPTAPSQEGPRSIHLACAPGKVGSRRLRHELSEILPALDALSPQTSDDGASLPNILVTCATGKDHSVGVALAILCLYVDDAGRLVARGETGRRRRGGMDKNFIKQRLSWIMVAVPDANPSRTTLQSVNAFLLG